MKVLAALLLTGCVHAYDSYEWRKVDAPSTVTVTVVYDTSPCEIAALGCAFLHNGRDCVIYLGRDTPELIGHEVAHCFGWRHD